MKVSDFLQVCGAPQAGQLSVVTRNWMRLKLSLSHAVSVGTISPVTGHLAEIFWPMGASSLQRC